MKQRISKTILTIMVIIPLIIVKPVSAANTQYSIIDLGTLGGAFSVGDGINDNKISERGQVIGHSTTAFDESHSFIWQNGIMTDLGVLDSEHSPEAISLTPTIRPLSLIATASLYVPPGSVPKSIMIPFCHRKACWFTPKAVLLAPTTCPLSLIA